MKALSSLRLAPIATALLVFSVLVPLGASSARDCSRTSVGYVWAPDLAGVRSNAQRNALLAAADALPAGGPLWVKNFSQSSGRDSFTALTRLLIDGTGRVGPVNPRVHFLNFGRSKKGIDEWATFWDPLEPATPSKPWQSVFVQLRYWNTLPHGYEPFVTPSTAPGYTRFWATSVSPPAAPPANLEAWKAGRRAKTESVLRVLHALFPRDVIELTGQDYPGYAVGREPLQSPWAVRAEDEVLEAIAREGLPLSAAPPTRPFVPLLDKSGAPVRFRALMYLTRLTNGTTPRLAIASASFPQGKFYPCSWFDSDGIHLTPDGYRSSVTNDAERWYADPVFSLLWR